MTDPTPGQIARGLLRTQDRATLATRGRPNSKYPGDPYASLVLFATDAEGAPILLISTLAEHTQNLLASGAVSLMVDGTAGRDDPLTGARVSIQGAAERTTDPVCRARFVTRHPASAGYADFGDFGFWRITPTRAHLVAGFGRIHWIERGDLMLDIGGSADLIAAEAEIVEHMNRDHADAVQLYATKLLGLTGDAWSMTGVDPEGFDLRRGGVVARMAFEKPVHDAETARVELVRLVKKARAA